jgi:DNA-binding CsgD family transcriptional regulator
MQGVGILSGIPAYRRIARYPRGMAKRTKKRISDQARRVSNSLSKAFQALATSEGLPKSAGTGEPKSDTLLSFDPVTGISDEEYRRLRLWLNELASEGDALAYAAVLQIWLNAHNIEWPKKVFAPGKDLTSRGRGSRLPGKSIDFSKAQRLRSQGKSLPQIARELGLAQNNTKAGRRKAADQLRKRLSRGFLSEALDEEVIERGLRMLGITVPQDFHDFMRREVGPAYDDAVK